MRNEVSEKGHERCLVLNRFSSDRFSLKQGRGLKVSAVSPYQTSLNIPPRPLPGGETAQRATRATPLRCHLLAKQSYAGLAKREENKNPPEPKAGFVWTKTVNAVAKC